MITPAVLISACGTLVLSTTIRLQRIVARVRELTSLADAMWLGQQKIDFLEERQQQIERQLEIQARRANIAQRALSLFYIALGIFVADSVAIGITTLRFASAVGVPVALGLIGTLVMLCGSVLMIIETRLALRTTRMEMAFSLKLGHLRADQASKRTEIE
jgi:hypothetical protein